MRVKRVVPDLGPAGDREDLLRTARYLDQLDQTIRLALRRGVGLSDLSKNIDLPEFAAWQGYPHVHRRNATKLYLELERALFDEIAEPATGNSERKHK
jgi:hypothetical protein